MIQDPSKPRRASVNSFGFGGLNGHAILEGYNMRGLGEAEPGEATVFTPIVFSAMSEHSLRALLREYLAYLRNTDGLNYRDLAWTLRQRRSLLPYRAAFVARSVEELASQIETGLQDEDGKVGIRALPMAEDLKPKILGIFTGQGAQYARMGAELIEKSPAARRIIHELGSHLARLPSKDRPTWSLEAELLADSTSSRVGEAALSQPLCTAVQILLVELLRLAKVHLACVVGHSSGEIAAAYAAGYLTARDAIVIAYYR
jgi:acyl transferase domain-containing protein